VACLTTQGKNELRRKGGKRLFLLSCSAGEKRKKRKRLPSTSAYLSIQKNFGGKKEKKRSPFSSELKGKGKAFLPLLLENEPGRGRHAEKKKETTAMITSTRDQGFREGGRGGRRAANSLPPRRKTAQEREGNTHPTSIVSGERERIGSGRLASRRQEKGGKRRVLAFPWASRKKRASTCSNRRQFGGQKKRVMSLLYCEKREKRGGVPVSLDRGRPGKENGERRGGQMSATIPLHSEEEKEKEGRERAVPDPRMKSAVYRRKGASPYLLSGRGEETGDLATLRGNRLGKEKGGRWSFLPFG